MKITIKVLRFCLLLLMIISCEKENSYMENLENSSEQKQEIGLKLNLDNFTDSKNIPKGNLVVDWDTGKEYNVDGGTWYEYAIQQKVTPMIVDEKITNIDYTLLEHHAQSGNVEYSVVKMDSHNGDVQYSYFDLSKRSFTGTVQVYDENGYVQMAQYYDKGNALQGVITEGTKGGAPLTKGSTAKCYQRGSVCDGNANCREPQTSGGSCGGTSGETSYGWQRVVTITDWYMDRNGDRIAQPSEYSSTTTEVTYNYVQYSGTSGPPSQNNYYSYGTSGFEGTATYPIKVPTEVKPTKITYLISDDKKCQKKIIHATTQNTHIISKLMRDVFGEEGVYNIEYSSADLKGSRAHTDFKVDKYGNIQKFVIVFDNTFLEEATDIAIYGVAFHENIHALLYYLAENGNITKYDELADLSALAEEYVKLKVAKEKNIEYQGYNNFYHHQAMSYLVDDIADGIEEFGDSRGYDLDHEYYTYLAWSGLHMTTTYATQYSDPDEQANFELAVQNTVDWESTNFLGLAEGKPCASN
ncbi:MULTISPECIES: hypothetical protein [Flavobacteriaceae]|uniref:hypothetical protein n=1 Tax=Flavobacteriaceae TaxID=49546 RepID=UPI001492E37C|nr:MULTISPECIES: hypothetical protein [Allomuricauda]MDC6367212.1 hypothetical protein [Muricauda sp. AC10]